MLGEERSEGPGSVGGRNMDSDRQPPAGEQAAAAGVGVGGGGGGGGERELAASRAVTRRSRVDSMRSRRSWTSSKRWALEFVYISTHTHTLSDFGPTENSNLRDASLSRFCRSEYEHDVFQPMQF